jgi:hypothetical protein
MSGQGFEGTLGELLLQVRGREREKGEIVGYPCWGRGWGGNEKEGDGKGEVTRDTHSDSRKKSVLCRLNYSLFAGL